MRKDRQPISQEFDQVGSEQGTDILVEQLDFGQDFFISEVPGYSLSFPDIYHAPDETDDIDFANDNERDICKFIIGQKNVVMVGSTLEQLKNTSVELTVKREILSGAVFNFVIANPDVNKPIAEMNSELLETYEKLVALNWYANIFGFSSAVKVFSVDSEFPEDFIWVGGWEDMLVRVQNEESRDQGSQFSRIVDYLSLKDPKNHDVLDSLMRDFLKMFESAQQIEI